MRGQRLTAGAAGIRLDYSKNRITDETLTLLVQLAREWSLDVQLIARGILTSLTTVHAT
jgi:glucose-6-phosphate isomerase